MLLWKILHAQWFECAYFYCKTFWFRLSDILKMESIISADFAKTYVMFINDNSIFLSTLCLFEWISNQIYIREVFNSHKFVIITQFPKEFEIILWNINLSIRKNKLQQNEFESQRLSCYSNEVIENNKNNNMFSTLR